MQLPSYLTGFSSKVDGSASIRFSTQELAAEDFAELQRNLNSFGWLAFRPNEQGAPELPDSDAEEGKTPSQRLRAILFVEYKQKGKPGDFEAYYRSRMDAICERLKSQLDQ